MERRNRQSGMTLWGLLFVLGVLAFFLFLGFRLLPVYLDDFKVRGALESLVKQSDIGSMSRATMVEALRKRFEIDDVRYADPNKHLTVEPRSRTKLIRISYQAVVPMVFNVSALLEFEHTREVRTVE